MFPSRGIREINEVYSALKRPGVEGQMQSDKYIAEGKFQFQCANIQKKQESGCEKSERGFLCPKVRETKQYLYTSPSLVVGLANAACTRGEGAVKI